MLCVLPVPTCPMAMTADTFHQSVIDLSNRKAAGAQIEALSDQRATRDQLAALKPSQTVLSASTPTALKTSSCEA
eukprot:3258043-Rhodomonas_salina.3